MSFKSIPGTNLSDNDCVVPSLPCNLNNYNNQQILHEQHLYPQLQINNQTDPNQQMKNDQKDESEALIELEPEGITIATPIPSFIPPINNQNINVICKSLHNSFGLFKSKNKRTKLFLNMILSTSKQQRQLIKNQYKNKYKISINKLIQKNFLGIYREILLYSFMSSEELIVNNIEYALQNKDINLLSTILCQLNNNQLKEIEKTFNSSIHHRNKKLKQWIDSITSVLFYKKNINKLLINIINCKRININQENLNINSIENDAKLLYKSTLNDLNRDILINMFTQRSFKHLYYVSLKYELLYNKSLINTLKHSFKKSSQTGYAICVILTFITKKYELYSTSLAKSIHDIDNNYSSFLRFIMLHYDNDLKNIIDNYGSSALESWIKFELRNKHKYNDITNVVMKLCGLS